MGMTYGSLQTERALIRTQTTITISITSKFRYF